MSTNLEGITLAEQYFLKKFIGTGSAAQIYQAWDRKRETDMAVKILHEIRFFESFIHEIGGTLMAITHPNIIRLYDVGKDDKMGFIFMVLDWVDGRDLQSIFANRNILEVHEVAYILEGIQNALNYIHIRGICHGNIKPGNILIRNSDNQIFLSDLGLAYLASVAHDKGRRGTLPFMAPELFEHGVYSIQSDIYALGVMLYQLLSGHFPFYGETREALIQEHKSKIPPPIQRINPNIPNEIALVIEKSLAKDPHQRQESVTEMYVEFSKYVTVPLKTTKKVATEKINYKSMSYNPSETPSKSRLFISYSSIDSETVNKLAKSLQKAGFDIWLDQKDIVIGQPILDRIRDGVTKESDYVLIILSKHSTVSEWCKLELRMAYEKEMTAKRVVVLPIRIDEAEVPEEVKTKKYFQLEITDKNSVNLLISQIKSLEKR